MKLKGEFSTLLSDDDVFCILFWNIDDFHFYV